MSLGITEELLNGPQAAPAERSVSLGVADELIKGPEMRQGPTGGNSQIADVADDPAKAVPLDIVLAAQLFPDENKKIEYLAQKTGIPRERWGVVDGNIVYADPQTNRYARAVPSVKNSEGLLDAWQRATKWIADQTGAAAPGIAGGVAGTMAGPSASSIPVASAVAAATDYLRQVAGNLMIGSEAPLSDVSALNIAGQAAGAGVGQAIPVGAMRAASRNPMKISPYDRKAAMDPATMAGAQQATQEAGAQGIPLSFGQSTGLRSALSGERQLARDPASMDTMQVFYDRQRELVGDAVRKQADSISPIQSVDEGVGRMREGAQAAVKTADNARKAVATPLYEKALENEERFWIPDLDPVMERPSVRKGIAYAKLIAKEEGRDITIPVYEKGKVVGRDVVPDWRSWDYIKRGVDRVIEENTDQFGKMTAYGRSVVQTKKDLLSILDKANPEYAAARKAFETASPEVTDLKQGAVGKLATQEGTEKIGEIRNLFNANQTNPGAVNKARVAYEKAGRRDDWNAGVATWIRDALDASTKTNKGGMVSARDLVSAVYRDENQKKLLKAAMSPDQFDGFTRMMNVIQNVARTMPEGSPTATDAAGMATLRSQFGGKVKMGQALMNLQLGDAILDRATLRLSDSGMAKLAEAVISPDNVQQLRKLRMMDPRSEKAVIAVSQLLGVMGIGASGAREPRGAAPASSKQGQQ